MSGVGVRVSREGPGLSLPASLSGTTGSVSGDNIDWLDGGGAPGTVPVTVDVTDFELKNEGGQSTIKAHGSMGSTETFDPTDGNVHTGTLDANCTFTLNVPTGTGACLLEGRILASGTHTWTWPGTVAWVGGVTPDPPADGETSIVLLETLDGGTSWVGVLVGGSGEPTADAHIADATDAHDASAVSVLDTGGYYTGTDVEAVLAEIPAQIATVAAAAAASGSHVHVMDCLFSGDASTTAFPLPVAPFDQYSVAAYVSGVLTEVTLSGTLWDTATFGSAPASATNNIRFDIVAATV